MKKLFLIRWLLASAVAVSGSSANAQAPIVANVAVLPAPAGAGQAIRLTFSAPVGASVAATAVVSGTETGRRAGTVSGSGTTWWFTPTIPFRAGEGLVVTVPAGAMLGASYVRQLTAPSTPCALQFRPVTIYPGNSEAHTVATADVDNDGDVDLVSDGSSIAYFVLSRNDGTGQFAYDSSGFYVYPRRNNLTFADLDGDGDPDLLNCQHGDTVAVFRNDGQGRFGNTQFLATGYGGENLVAADANGDTFLDIIASGFNSSMATVFINDGTGQFSTAASSRVQVAPSNRSLRMLDVVDMDADGDLDLVAATELEYRVCLNNGLGNFSPQPAQSLLSFQFWLNRSATGDLTNDGISDLLTLIGTGGARLLPGTGTGGFGAAQPLAGVDSVTLDAFPADFDGDGDYDLLGFDPAVGPSGQVNGWSIFANDGSGGFALAFTTQLVGLTNDLHHFTSIADYDGDGRLDFTVSYSSDSVVAFLTAPPLGRVEVAPKALLLAPNPAPLNSKLWLEQISETAGTVQIQDLLGRTLRTITLPADQPRVLVSLAGLPAGCYFVQVGKHKQRLLIQ